MKVKNISKKNLNFIYRGKSIGIKPGQMIVVDDELGKSISRDSSVMEIPDYEKIEERFEEIPEIERELPPIVETPIVKKPCKPCGIPSYKIKKSKKVESKEKNIKD